jgi:hypothetical protein
MLNIKQTNKLKLAMLLALPLALAACGSDNDTTTPEDTSVDVSYQVTITNLTNAQPLSPAAVVLHTDGNLFAVGEEASVALEQMAEGGMNAELLTLGISSASGAGIIMPGASETINVTVQDITDAKLSVTTMLVNTNDAFTGLNAMDLSDLEVGSTWTKMANVYDSGTEVNDEAAGTMPGPADNGEGFNPARTDTGFVSMHPGVVTSDDGLPSSVLNVQHKFDNPAIRIKVTRTE